MQPAYFVSQDIKHLKLKEKKTVDVGKKYMKISQ